VADDALHALSCAAGYNIRWLLRAIVRLGLGGLFYALSAVIAYAASLLRPLPAWPRAMGSMFKALHGGLATVASPSLAAGL
jgi:IS5 family transposase